MSVFIQAANQISAQKPLTDEWMTQPIFYAKQPQRRVPTIDPDFSPHFAPLVSRRICKLLKRAVLLSRLTLQQAEVAMPDAIISGTGLGCIDNTEQFIRAIMNNGEQLLQPTYFMQSTHNILSSTIAIDLKCHGYNNTFVNRGVSFENALLDAVIQLKMKRIRTALVGGYDEMTDDYHIFFDRLGIWDFEPDTEVEPPFNHCFAGEAAVGMLLNDERNEHTICELKDIALMFRPDMYRLQSCVENMSAKSDIDAVFMGLNTQQENDNVYCQAIQNRIFGDIPVAGYKHLFGESFSSSSLGIYAAAKCLKQGFIPDFMIPDYASSQNGKPPRNILIYNHYRNRSHSLTLLSSC